MATQAPMERVAVLGTGKMGEALLSGMLRAGRKPADVLVTARRPERAELLAPALRRTGRSTTPRPPRPPTP